MATKKKQRREPRQAVSRSRGKGTSKTKTAEPRECQPTQSAAAKKAAKKTAAKKTAAPKKAVKKTAAKKTATKKKSAKVSAKAKAPTAKQTPSAAKAVKSKKGKPAATEKAAPASQPAAAPEGKATAPVFKVINCDGKWVVVDKAAKEVKLKDAGSMRFFVHKRLDGPGFSVSEAMSGSKIADGKTAAEATANAQHALNSVGRNAVYKKVQMDMGKRGGNPDFMAEQREAAPAKPQEAAGKDAPAKKLYMKYSGGNFVALDNIAEQNKKRVKVKGMEEYELYAVFTENNAPHPMWTLLEPVSGTAFASRDRDQKKMLAMVEEAIGKAKPGEIAESLAKAIEQDGTAPGWDIPAHLQKLLDSAKEQKAKKPKAASSNRVATAKPGSRDKNNKFVRQTDAAVVVLRDFKEPVDAAAIYAEIEKRKLWECPDWVRHPQRGLASAMSREVNQMGADARFTNEAGKFKINKQGVAFAQKSA